MFQGAKKPGWETGQIRVIGSGVASRRLDETGKREKKKKLKIRENWSLLIAFANIRETKKTFKAKLKAVQEEEEIERVITLKMFMA